MPRHAARSLCGKLRKPFGTGQAQARPHRRYTTQRATPPEGLGWTVGPIGLSRRRRACGGPGGIGSAVGTAWGLPGRAGGQGDEGAEEGVGPTPRVSRLATHYSRTLT